VSSALEPFAGRCRAYRPGMIEVKLATRPWELAGYYRLRRHVFCGEQGVFAEGDVDEHDALAQPIVAVVHTAGIPDRVVGTVRIYEVPGEAGHWLGGRLTTAPDLRRTGKVGRTLIHAAVSGAHSLGCRRFFAYVQAAKERYFQRYWFQTLRKAERFGEPHVFMEADLDHYPPRAPSGLFTRTLRSA
jgi:putative N-acetyltransferase (TIGR04045 family)